MISSSKSVSFSNPVSVTRKLFSMPTAPTPGMAGNYTSYMTDMTRVFSVGKLTEEAYRAHQVALTIQNEIENTARPGVVCEIRNWAISHGVLISRKVRINVVALPVSLGLKIDCRRI